MANILATDINNKRTTLVNYASAKSNTINTLTAVTANNKALLSNYTQIATAINSLEGAWSNNCCESNHCQSCQSDKNQSCQNSCTNCTSKNQSCQNSCANCTSKNQACQSSTNQGCQSCQNTCTNQSCQNTCTCQSCQTAFSQLLAKTTLVTNNSSNMTTFASGHAYVGRTPIYFGLQTKAGSDAHTDFYCNVGNWSYTLFTYYGSASNAGIIFYYTTTKNLARTSVNGWNWAGDALYSWINNVGDRNNPEYTSDTSNMNYGTKWKGVFQTDADIRSATQWRVACALHYKYKNGTI